nr:MAG: RNA-dependent RNA polymerase [Wufeng shrew nodavirus 12]
MLKEFFSMVKLIALFVKTIALIYAWGSGLYEYLESPSLTILLMFLPIIILAGYRRIAGYVEIGPYPTIVENRFTRTCQRILVDITKKDLGKNWYPLNSLLNVKPFRNSDNGHPRSGACRDFARNLITSALDQIGCNGWEISRAKQSKSEKGPHQHYAVGDLHLNVQEDPPDERDVIVGVDVDYYFRDPDEYLSYGVPMILHTFNPTEVSGKDGESRFRIKNNEVFYDVSGGSRWRHKVWDWCTYGEFVEAEVKRGIWYWLRWIGLSKVIYHKVHYSRPWEDCPNRVLVWTIPAHSCVRFNWIQTDLNARRLQRVKYSDEFRLGWNALVNQVKDKLSISCGRQGEDASFSMKKEDYDVLMGLSSAQSVTSRMLGMGYTDASLMAMVGQYFSGKEVPKGDPARVGNPIKAKVHWPLANEVDEPETTTRVYATPIVTDSNLMPMIKRWESLSISLDRRVTSYHNNKTPSLKMQAFASEFVKLVTPENGVGAPYSMEETAEKLNKPSQTLAIKQIWETIDMGCRKLIEAFVKNEPCMKTGRIISSFADMRFIAKFSSFTLAFRDSVLHGERNDHWFCPGKTPKEIAEKVCNYVKSIFTPMEADYENMDGSVSAWIQRHVVNPCYLRWFHPKYRAELTGYLDMLISCPARAKRFGFRYDAGVGVKSGSPTTCDGNSIIDAFVMYCSIRMTQPELTMLEAFRMIGLAFGDDSLFDEMYKKQMLKVVDDLGMKIKIEKFKPDQGLTFLARVYPDPYTTTTTFQDPLRTWRKLHLTSRDPNIPTASAALDRLSGYLVTDGLTPVTSNYANMVTRYYEGLVDTETKEVREKRRTCDREKPFWLTEGGSWPQDVKDVDLMTRVIAARTGFDEETLRTLCSELDECTNPWAEFTLNRDEEPNPYKDTLDEDAQPCSGSVDHRLYQNDKNNMQTRANAGAPKRATSAPNPSVRNPDSRGSASNGSQRQKGSGSVPRVPRRNNSKSPARDKESLGETKSQVVAARKVVGPVNSGNKRPDQEGNKNTGKPLPRGGGARAAPMYGAKTRGLGGRSRRSSDEAVGGEQKRKVNVPLS